MNDPQHSGFPEDLHTDLNRILDGIGIAVVAVGLDACVSYANAAALNLLGTDQIARQLSDWPETYGLYFGDKETFCPVDRIPLMRALQGEVVDREELILQPESEARWIAMSAYPLMNEAGKVCGAAAVLRETTDRRNADLARRGKERHLSILGELSRSILEAGVKLQRVSEIIVETTAELMEGACLLSLVSEDGSRLKITAVADQDESAQAVMSGAVMGLQTDVDSGLHGSVVTSGETLIIPSVPADQAGTVLPTQFGPYIQKFGLRGILIAPLKTADRVLGVLSLLRSGQDKPLNQDDQSLLVNIAHRTTMAIVNAQLLQAVQHELAQRKEAEHSLAQRESLFRSIFTASPLGIKLLDSDGNIIRTNQAFEALLGYAQDDLVGRRFSEFTHPADLAVAEQYFRNLVSDRTQRLRQEKRYYTSSGEFVWANLSLTSVRSEEGELQFVMAVVEDITARKQVESDLAEVRSRLLDGAELERLKLAQDLHDGPMQDLHSVHYQVQALLPNVDEQTGSVLHLVSETVDSVLASLRSAARELRPPAIMDFGLARAIQSHAEELRVRHPETRIGLALTDDASLLPERYRLALFRIFQQAVMNSILHGRAANVLVRLMIDPEEIILEIEDDGAGFKVPDNWINLVRQGHFGLAGAAERVAALGGRLVVDSSPGQGALLRVVIPRSIEEATEHG